METKNSPDKSGILPNGDTQNWVQPHVEETPRTVPEEDYKNLQAFATRTRQFAIKTALDAVEQNPRYISSIEDKSVQDAVVKQKHGFDSYDQMIAVMWENFVWDTSQWGNGDNDENAQNTFLEKEVRLLKYQHEQSQVDSAIAEFKSSNPQLFTDETSEQKLRDELKFISTSLPIKERIKRSAQITLVQQVDPSTVAFSALNFGRNPTNSWTPNPQLDAKKIEQQKQIEAWRKLFWLTNK